MLVAAGAYPSRLQAQSSGLRAELDSVIAAADSGHPTPAPASIEGSDPATRLRRGFAGLIAADSSTAPDRLGSALLDFYEVTVKHPDWPYGWLGLGLTKLRLDDLSVPEIRSPHQPAGTGWISGALPAFEEALKLEPSLGRAVEGMAEVLRRSPPGSTASRAAAILTSYAQTHQLDATAALALERVAYRRGNIDAAAGYLKQYLANGGDPGIGAWEAAAIRFAQNDPSGGTEQYFTAATGGIEAIRLLRDNLALIALPAELRSFDSCPPSTRPGWLRSFWARREVTDGRPAGTRLPEHFRRIRYARAHFDTRASIPQYTFEQLYQGAPRGLDDRGEIYIRHGDPDQRATFIGGPGTYPNESWEYFRPNGNLLFHFVEIGPGGFRLVEDLSVVSPDHLAELYESRAGLDIRFLRLANLYDLEAGRGRTRVQEPPLISPETLERERQHNRRMIRIGTTTDADPLDLERSWEPIVQAFGTVDPATDSTGLLVVVALPAPRDLPPISLPDGGTGYVLHLRATAARDSLGVTFDSDLVRRLRTPHPLRSDESLTLVEHFALPPGDQRLRLIVADSTESRGAVRLFPDVPVVALAKDSLAMSDLITGRVGSGVTWRRPDGHLIELQPTNLWHPNDVMSVAFDVGGLAAGTSYKVRIGVADLGADTLAPPKASVEFENQASGAREFVAQSLGLRSLKPGRYLLTVTVTTPSGVLKRDRRITIAGQ